MKMSAETYNAYLDPFVKPVVEKGKQEYNSIKEKINSSENENVKYARGIHYFKCRTGLNNNKSTR